MDFGTSITGIGIILACIFLFGLMILNSNKKEKKFLQELLALAATHNCQITRYDIWENTLIGLDDSANMIFFIKNNLTIPTVQVVDLAQVQQCQLLNEHRIITNKEGSHKVTDLLTLLFTFQTKGKKEVRMDFYNVNLDSLILKGELQLIEKWETIVMDKIHLQVSG